MKPPNSVPIVVLTPFQIVPDVIARTNKLFSLFIIMFVFPLVNKQRQQALVQSALQKIRLYNQQMEIEEQIRKQAQIDLNTQQSLYDYKLKTEIKRRERLIQRVKQEPAPSVRNETIIQDSDNNIVEDSDTIVIEDSDTNIVEDSDTHIVEDSDARQSYIEDPIVFANSTRSDLTDEFVKQEEINNDLINETEKIRNEIVEEMSLQIEEDNE